MEGKSVSSPTFNAVKAGDIKLILKQLLSLMERESTLLGAVTIVAAIEEKASCPRTVRFRIQTQIPAE